MSVSEPARIETNNSLHRVAAGTGVLVGIFLLLGGFGHLAGVRPAFEQAISTPGESGFALLLPGLLLLAAGLVDIGLCRALWRGARWSINLGLVCNTLATAYVAYLLAQGVPDHPIGTFLALLASFVLLLGAIRAGLVWPAAGASSDR